MNTINIPGFVAEKAIYRSHGCYRTAVASGASRAANGGGTILPAVPVSVDEEEQLSTDAGDVSMAGSNVRGPTHHTARRARAAETAWPHLRVS